MMVSAVLVRGVAGVLVAALMHFGVVDSLRSAPPSLPSEGQVSEYAKLPACAPIKGKPAQRARSTDVAGAKRNTKTLQCFPKADVTAGQKILNGLNRACFACHGIHAEYNPQVMIQNLRAQGDGTLKLQNIIDVNNAHLEDMLGAVATVKELKKVRAYLKVKFKG